MDISAHLQGLLCCAARLLLQFARRQSLNVFVTLLVTVVQQVLFGLQQTLARRHVADTDGKTPVS